MTSLPDPKEFEQYGQVESTQQSDKKEEEKEIEGDKGGAAG